MNRLRDELRRKARTPGTVDLGDPALSERSRVEKAVGVETMAAYEQALRRLKPEEQEAVIGRIELGLSYGELALALERPQPMRPARRRSGRSSARGRDAA